jgi:pyridoxamine 5'-phosphate oxidase
MHWACAWLAAATNGKVQRNPNCMTLVTVGPEGKPSARVVLCKSFEADPGYVVMYTNYESQKCREVEQNANVCVLFHWDSMGRQIRIGGTAVRSPAEESDAYFASRDGGSQLGAWGSDQSRPIESHEMLVRQIRERAREQGVSLSGDHGTTVAENSAAISRPPHWGGVRIWASSIELWIEGRDRIHDRALWKRKLTRTAEDEFSVSVWAGTRLQP